MQRDLQEIQRLILLYQEADACLAQHHQDLRRKIQELADKIDVAYTVSNLSELLVRSRDGLRRIQNIVKDLRNFARLDESDLKENDLNAGIESTVNIVRPKARGANVNLDLDLAPLPPVACYGAKINQVVLNLVANAIDACRAGGRVVVRTRPEERGVCIEVEDTGCGIPAEVRSKIFDPFFTTKPVGSGTGLGLSISHGIVCDHGGRIDLDTQPGKGTTFYVRLPLARPDGS